MVGVRGYFAAETVSGRALRCMCGRVFGNWTVEILTAKNQLTAA